MMVAVGRRVRREGRKPGVYVTLGAQEFGGDRVVVALLSHKEAAVRLDAFGGRVPQVDDADRLGQPLPGVYHCEVLQRGPVYDYSDVLAHAARPQQYKEAGLHFGVAGLLVRSPEALRVTARHEIGRHFAVLVFTSSHYTEFR